MKFDAPTRSRAMGECYRCPECGNMSVIYNMHFQAFICNMRNCGYIDRETGISVEEELEREFDGLMERDRYGVLIPVINKFLVQRRQAEKGLASKTQ